MNDRGDDDPNYVRELIAGERTYEEGSADGYRQGVLDTLAAVEGTLLAADGSSAKSGRYAGPVPRELKQWIAIVRERMAAP